MISKIRPAIIEKADGYIPLLLSFTIITFFVGLYFSLIESPADYIQGDSMRIMYIHVPSAWFSPVSYTHLTLPTILRV